MDREEFRKWAIDFGERFPASGDFLGSLPSATREKWFDEIFAGLTLADCLEVSRRIMAQGDLAAYQREHIPSIFIKRCSELKWERDLAAKKRADEQFKKEQGENSFAGTRARFTPIMKRILKRVEFAQREYSETHGGEWMPDADRRQLLDELFDELDTDPDDRESQPRYKCLECRDTGFVSFRDDRGRPMCGHCGCERGIKRRDQFTNEGRTLGAANPTEVKEWAFE